MFRTRSLLVLLIVLGLLAAFAPAIALAGGGSSAGDNQYVDPLSGLHSHGGRGSGSSSSGSGTAGSSATPASSTPTATSPTATSAASTSTDPKRRGTLPFTGFEDWQAAGLGLVLMVGGLGIRRRTHADPRRTYR